MIFTNVFKKRRELQVQDQRTALYRNLIRREAKIGGQLFGSIPEGHRREFFCLDRHTWIWHEEWVNSDGQRQIVTTRYDVRPSGILKAQNGQHYQQLTRQETLNLRQAAQTYVARMKQELYSNLI